MSNIVHGVLLEHHIQYLPRRHVNFFQTTLQFEVKLTPTFSPK